MIGMFVRKPDVRDARKRLVRESGLRQQRPSVVEGAPLKPGIADHSDGARFNDKAGMIDKFKVHDLLRSYHVWRRNGPHCGSACRWGGAVEVGMNGEIRPDLSL
jgi:hypothetical protein